MARILVVEDELAIRQGLTDKLEMEGYQVTACDRGDTAWELLEQGPFDLLVLDLMLPGLDGLEICRRLRAARNYLPIIMLTAKAEEIDKVVGLELGADDYMTKPFSIRELLARVKAHLRRATFGQPPPEGTPAARFSDVEADFAGARVTKAGQEVHLTPLELKVLQLLWERQGRVVTRNRFLDEVWGYDHFPTTRTVDFHILQLRKKLEDDPNNPTHILTVHGMGYRFDAAAR